MMILPQSESCFKIMPETEVEAFYVEQFLKLWRDQQAQIIFQSGVMGVEPQSQLILSSKIPDMLPMPIFLKSKKKL